MKIRILCGTIAELVEADEEWWTGTYGCGTGGFRALGTWGCEDGVGDDDINNGLTVDD